MPSRTLLIPILILLIAGCGGEETDPRTDPGNGLAGHAEARPATRRAVISVAGTPEPVELRRFDAPDGFPLPFSTYVPPAMVAELDPGATGDGAAVRFVAEIGGAPNEDALVHVRVHPPGTDAQEALGVVRAYSASHGIPVSQGIEPLPDPDVATTMPWADAAYTFRYQAGGQWFEGTIGLGAHGDRLFHVIHHYPAEYSDRFGPYARVIMETWQWADGTGL